MNHSKLCPNCGAKQVYATKLVLKKAVHLNRQCNRCKMTTPELKHLMSELHVFVGWYAVYLLPEENYVGVSKHPKSRIAQHKNKNRNIKNAAILYWARTAEEAAYVEASYHFDGYAGCQLNRRS